MRCQALLPRCLLQVGPSTLESKRALLERLHIGERSVEVSAADTITLTSVHGLVVPCRRATF